MLSGVYGDKKAARISARLSLPGNKLLLLDIVFFLELLDAARCVNQLLLLGVEGMAVGADFHVQILNCGTGMNLVAAGTLDNRFLVFGMDAGFHDITPYRFGFLL